MEENKKEIFISGWLIAIGIFITVGVVGYETHLSWSPDPKFSFENYGGTFKVITFFIAITAIILAIKRMQQTKVQTDVLIDNVKFNNYFKHRDRFLEHCLQYEVINKILAKIRKKNNEMFLTYYGYYFCKSYKEFSDHISSKIKLLIDEYVETLESSALNQQESDLQSIDLNEIINVVTKFKYHEDDVRLIILLSGKHDKDFQIKHDDLKAKAESDRFFLLFCIFFTISIVSIIKSFEGEDIKGAPEFMINYFTYLKKLKMETWLLGDY